MMRTTIDLPPDLYQRARSLARDTHRTFSATVVELMRRGLEAGGAAAVARSPRTRLPLIRLGRVITTEDVRALDDGTE